MNAILERSDAKEKPVKEVKTLKCVWYIPHHGLYHPKKRDKIRIVFDCSAYYHGSSLNDHLLQGPNLMNFIGGVLCRFRENLIAIMRNIEKMFNQFRDNHTDRD